MGEVRGGGGGGLLLLTSPLYNHINPHSDHCPHALIRTPYANCAASSMPLLSLTLSFSGRINPPPPPNHSPNNDNLFPLHPLPLSIFSLFLLKLLHQLTS